MPRILIAFVTVILSFCVALPLISFGYEWYEQKLIDAVWWSGLSTVIAGCVGIVIWTSRDYIFQKLKLSTKVGAQHLIDPAVDIVQHATNRDLEAALNESRILIKRLVSKYVAIKTTSWVIGTTFGFLAIFATMAATAILIKQNRLINTQNTYFKTQNEKFESQNALIESQNKYFQEQNSKIQKQLDEQAVERKRADRNRLIAILYEEKDVDKEWIKDQEEEREREREKGVADGLFGFSLGFVVRGEKRKVPKANLRLRQEAVLEFIKLERDAGRKGQELDLSGAILCDLDLSNERLKKVGLDQALKGANLEGGHLEGARLEGTHLQGTRLARAHLEGADLNSAHLERAYLRRVQLEGADLERAHLEGADLYKAYLEGANLNEANLEGAELASAHLKEAHLRNANLIGARLGGAHLERASLEEAHLDGANLLGTYLDKAYLMNAVLKKAYLERASLEEADLSFANLEEAHLKWANLEGSFLQGTHFEGTNLSGANLKGTDLRDVYLEGAQAVCSADLEGAVVDSLSWLKEINPPVKKYCYAYWSIIERIDKYGDTIYVLVGPEPLEAKKPNLEN